MSNAQIIPGAAGIRPQSFTTSQLGAIGASASKIIGIAYCTDCINSGSLNGVGAMVRWSEASQQWMTFHDNVPATTDLMVYAVQLNARGGAGVFRKGPALSFYCIPSGLFAPTVTQSGNATNAFGQTNNGLAATMGIHFPLRAQASQLGAARSIVRVTGTAPTYQGAGAATSSAGLFGTVASGEERRAMVLVGSLNSFIQSGATAGVNDYAWRFGICTQNSDMTTTPSTFIGFFYDRSNNAGWAAGTSDTVRAHVRINGTTLLDPTTTPADTLIAPGNLAHMLMAIAVEPTGTSGNNARVRVAWLQGRSGSWTTVYDSTQSFGSSTERLLQSIAAVAVGVRTSATSELAAIFDQILSCTAFVGGSTGNQPVNPPMTIPPVS